MIGDQQDVLRRQRATLGSGWFPDQSPVLDAVLSGFSLVGSQAHSLLMYVRQQGRIKTASDGFLDLIAFDFFGLRVKRRNGQGDDQLRATIIAEIFRDRVTRTGIQKAVGDLTGFDVRMFEPFNARDTGGFNTPYLGWNCLGRWGSLMLPRQIFIATLNPRGAGIPNVGGFNDGHGGWDKAPGMWGSPTLIKGAVTQADVYDVINATRAMGVTPWVSIGYPPEARLDDDFILDQSLLE
jgi:hypothetical protein